MFCKRCGKQLTKEDLFCSSCGCKNVQLEKDNQKKRSKNRVVQFMKDNKVPIVIISVLALVFLCIVGNNAHKKYQRDKLWREYKSLQSSGNYTSSDTGGIDFANLHKYSNSTYKIGSDMPSGEYVIFALSDNGYFCLSSDSTGNSIICNNNFSNNSIITVRDGEYLELSRCYAEPIRTAKDVSTTGEGMFKIGTHLSAGEYKLEATGSSGYYSVYSDDRQDDIAYNDNFEGITYVTVKEGQYLELSRCKITK